MLMLLLCCAATNLRRSPVGVILSLFLFFLYVALPTEKRNRFLCSVEVDV